ncbi:MAG: 4-diphosphocytidyl-2C-methyl-D-erythritol kinase [Candidatus Solibacter sp.]|nr:4-diphosphocytidyl-2C-methyl-D-erythritol kinase [Candidatus Solibacter sp.]
MNPRSQPVAAIILAAGASSRMGFPKPLLDCGGETFLDRLISVFATACEPVIAVLGHHAELVREGSSRAGEAAFVLNPDPDHGMISSLQTGLAAVPAHCNAVFFHPCDMPQILPATIQTLIAALAAAPPEILAAIPTLDGRRGHPVLIRASWIPAFLALPTASTAKSLLESASAAVIEVPVADPGIRRDFDTRAEYASAFGVRP